MVLATNRAVFSGPDRGELTADNVTAWVTDFTMQRPRCLVEETIQMIEEFGLDEKRVYMRVGVQWRFRTIWHNLVR